MLLTRRLALLSFCLAGMEVAWLTPFFLLVYRPAEARAPWLVFLGLFATLLAGILALEALSLLQIDWPYYELSAAGLVIAGSLLFVRLWLYWGMPAGDFRWLPNTLGALFDFSEGVRPELILLAASAVLWQRATNATSRDVGFFGVGVSFRLGLLLLILGAGLLSALRGRDASALLWIYLALGLVAVAFARAYEKAAGARSQGSSFSLDRLRGLFLAVGVTVGAASGLSLLVTPQGVKLALLAALRPLWMALEPALRFVFQGLFWLLMPLMLWLESLVRRFAESLDWSFLEEMADRLQENRPPEELSAPGEGPLGAVPPWVWDILRYALILLAISVALGLVLLFLDRIRRETSREEAEEAGGEELTLGGAALGRGVRWLRGMAGLVRRFGLSQQLLAAISVEAMYANLCRLARRRGHARRPAQPPDAYLPVLQAVFAGHDQALARVTAAYMQVHYGDQPVTPGELSELRKEYEQVRRAASS